MRKITCLILALALTLLCGCGSKSGGDDAQGSGSTQQTEEFVITPMASGLELEPYSCADFSMSIPQGWTVEAAASNAGMFHALRAYDPTCSVNQILYILKTEPLFLLRQNLCILPSDAGGVCSGVFHGTAAAFGSTGSLRILL